MPQWTDRRASSTERQANVHVPTYDGPSLSPRSRHTCRSRDDLLDLQRSVGNAAVIRVLRTNGAELRIQRNPFAIQAQALSDRINNWNPGAQRGDAVKSATLKETLRHLVGRGDQISFNTVDYVLTEMLAGSLSIVKAALDQNVQAQAARVGKGMVVRLNQRYAWNDYGTIGTVLVHEINHVVNEVGQGVTFTQEPVLQYLTEFRAYLVAGNWPQSDDAGTVQILDDSKNSVLNSIVEDRILRTGEGRTQSAFQIVRLRFLQGVRTDMDGEESIRGRLAQVLHEHIRADYPYARVDDVIPKQLEIGWNFTRKKVLPGNLDNA